MKSSKLLLAAARAVENGHWGMYSAIPPHPLKKYCSRIVDGVMDGRYTPAYLPAEHRATILCLAAAIAESDGD